VLPRGPKGWVRADARILDELCERIVRAGVDASELAVEVRDGEVSIEGELATREERRFVVDLAERTLGVAAVTADVRLREAGEAEEQPAPTWH
jgi:osmotically-inducible protein OsmY